jgi:hypothetical protein
MLPGATAIARGRAPAAEQKEEEAEEGSTWRPVVKMGTVNLDMGLNIKGGTQV